MQVITVYGLASMKKITIEVSKDQMQWTLLRFLTNEKIPIASSCRGVGSCGLCSFDTNKLSCQTKVLEVLSKTIFFDYL